MSDYKNKVPKKFYKDTEEAPQAATVGDLLDLLAELPRDLPIIQGFGDGCSLFVYNVSRENPHLSFEDSSDF